jgi:hypothetical protein
MILTSLGMFLFSLYYHRSLLIHTAHSHGSQQALKAFFEAEE